MNSLVLVILAALVVLLVGSVLAAMRYRYTRPNTASVRLIAILTVVLAILTVGVYALPQVTASPGGNSRSGFAGSPTTTHSPAPVRSPTPRQIPSPTGSTTIEIGSDLPASGAEIDFGIPAQNGIHLAIDEANANHTIPGYTLVYMSKDDVGASGTHDPAIGASNVTALIGDALVAGIIGPLNSSVAQAEMPITNQAPIALISPSTTNPCLTKNTPQSGCTGANDRLASLRPTGNVNFFRIAATDDNQPLAAANYLFTTLHYRSAYVIDDAEGYGVNLATGFIQAWQSAGGSVLGHVSLSTATTNYSAELTRIAAAKPDVIYFGGLDATGGTAIRQQMLQVQGLQNTPFVGGDGIDTSTFATTIGTSGGPVYSTNAFIAVSDLPQDFVTRYQAAYGQPGIYSAYGYDCANILIQAIKTALAGGAITPANSSDSAGAMTFRQAVILALKQISYDGLTGHKSFDANGDTTAQNFSVYQLADVNGQPVWKFIITVMVK